MTKDSVENRLVQEMFKAKEVQGLIFKKLVVHLESINLWEESVETT